MLTRKESIQHSLLHPRALMVTAVNYFFIFPTIISSKHTNMYIIWIFTKNEIISIQQRSTENPFCEEQHFACFMVFHSQYIWIRFNIRASKIPLFGCTAVPSYLQGCVPKPSANAWNHRSSWTLYILCYFYTYTPVIKFSS